MSQHQFDTPSFPFGPLSLSRNFSFCLSSHMTHQCSSNPISCTPASNNAAHLHLSLYRHFCCHRCIAQDSALETQETQKKVHLKRLKKERQILAVQRWQSEALKFAKVALSFEYIACKHILIRPTVSLSMWPMYSQARKLCHFYRFWQTCSSLQVLMQAV